MHNSFGKTPSAWICKTQIVKNQAVMAQLKSVAQMTRTATCDKNMINTCTKMIHWDMKMCVLWKTCERNITYQLLLSNSYITNTAPPRCQCVKTFCRFPAIHFQLVLTTTIKAHSIRMKRQRPTPANIISALSMMTHRQTSTVQKNTSRPNTIRHRYEKIDINVQSSSQMVALATESRCHKNYLLFLTCFHHCLLYAKAILNTRMHWHDWSLNETKYDWLIE